jgi:hypothetical protein
MRTSAAWTAWRVVALSVVASACGTHSSAGLVDGGTAAGDDSEPSRDANSTTSTDEAGSFASGDDAPAQSGCSRCSADLHQMLDCATGQVVRSCPDGTGCGAAGQCVAPCEAAASNHSSVGCDYYSFTPYVNGDPACFAAFIANTWTSPVSVGVEFDGQTLDVSKSLYVTKGTGAGLTYAPVAAVPPDQVGILFLANIVNGAATGQCPSGVTLAYSANPGMEGGGLGSAFHITTSAPVVAYDIYPYGGASAYLTSATLLLPTSVWDVNYVAVSAWSGPGTTIPFAGDIALVASQDATTVSFTPTGAIEAWPGIPAAASGSTQMYALNKGQIIRFAQAGNGDPSGTDLSGSIVTADKPIGLWAGHVGMGIPTQEHSADSGHQQIPPVKALGSEYVAVRYRSRLATEESVPWRILGTVDGTQLSYDPTSPANAPSTLARGQLVEFDSTGPFVVSSQDAAHPFYLAGHMTSSDYLNISMGDPETVNLVPPQQFLNHYVFFTDPTYGETNLVVVRSKSTGKDVTLDCQSGPLTGWQAAGSRYEFTRVDVQHNGAAVGGCANGRHEMKSDAPFGLTVWGWDTGVSYAYPAGASVAPINTVVVSPPPPK